MVRLRRACALFVTGIAEMVSERVIHAAVVVLGDLGRSPRMLYHARSLALHGANVDLIGYAGSELPRDVVEHPRIRCHRIKDSGSPFLDRGGYLRIGLSAVRMAVQGLKLFALLFLRIRKPDILLLQNPPGVPALAVMLVCARLRAARLVVDWHNFGYTVLALKLPAQSVPVRLTRWYEQTLGSRADAHLCVSEAMREELEERWRLKNVSVVDRPARKFAPARPDERRLLYRSLSAVLGDNGARGEQRTALLVSATSWTPDEDFGVLLEALAMVEAKIRGCERFPSLSVVISGDGPLRGYYEKSIAALPPGRISVRTAWLAAEDYPLLLRAADLGLCLHRSSSGLDLPMKLADMLGSGLPVLALDYGACLREQLRDGENGFLFSTPAELAERIFDLFKDFPASAPTLERMRGNIAAATVPRWDDEWNARAWPAMARCLNENR
jgi:beta-1,4-mannosyltransferase